ncbi:inositol monophosphatase family protein [Pacificibacter marinus]|uniref:inositol monophosphatase family protein n=1 Tax=Pacificibacter marinus TaxID=658057 RepID=UPI0027B922E0|nr:3'(2'),5'-bisphosphate nucleotidase CysQ [Pacificibacter marinus]
MLNDLDLLIKAAQAAGEIARPFWRKHPKIWDKGDGAGPVTEADLAVDKMLHDTLLTARPSYGWLSEETTDTDTRLSKEHVFIVDPIDGTRSFIEGDHNWAHSLAVVENGEVVAAVVYLPMRKRLFAAQKGLGATLNGAPLKTSTMQELDGARLLTARHNLVPQFWQNGCPDFVQKFRPSLAYRMSLVAEGRFDAMLSLRNTWEWDVAAGTLIANEAGAQVTDRNGDAPVFNQSTPAFDGFIAANPVLASSIAARLMRKT